MDDGVELDRRTLLRGAGALGSLSLFAEEVAAGTGVAETTPPEERSIEAGLAAFASKYETLGAVVGATRFGRFLTGTEFNLHVADQPRAWTLSLGPRGAGATLTPGASPVADVEVSLDAADWEAVLYGDYTGLAPVVDGRSYPSRDEANSAVLLLLVMYVAAHVPASADYDAEFLAGTVEGAIRRGGVPQCEGTPPAIELADQLEENPRGRVGEEVLGANEAPPVTEHVAEWVADLSYDDLPDAEVAAAKAQLMSIVAVSQAGSTMGTARSYLDAVQHVAADGTATVLGAGPVRSASGADAAMINSYLAQMLGWEDFTYLGHSGAAIVATALGAAEAADRAVSGEELVTAVAAGNEILARCSDFATDVVHAGQTLAVHQAELPFVAGTVLGLSVDQLRAASGVACTQPQMTTLPSFSAATKGFVTAEPAHTAVRAAGLAKGGFVGRRDLLENPLGYFYRVADVRSPRSLRLAVEGLNRETPADSTFRFPRQYFNKAYPTNGFHLTAVDAALAVREKLRERGLAVDDPDELATEIEEITLRVPLVTAATGSMFSEGEHDYLLERVLDEDEPEWTYVALLFDSVFPVVAALLAGELTHRQYRSGEGDFLGDERVGHLATLYRKTEASPDLSQGIFGAGITVETGNGSVRTDMGIDDLREGDVRGAATEAGDGAAETVDGATDPARGEEASVGPDEEASAAVACVPRGETHLSFAARKVRRAVGDPTVPGDPETIIDATRNVESYTVRRYVRTVAR